MMDRFRLIAKGGDGGSGCSSIRRSRRDRRGRADGGNGGRGADVILECSPSVWDFSGLHHHINANRGGHGASKNMIGSRGADKVVRVPVGTVIHVVEGAVSSKIETSSSSVLNPWEILGDLSHKTDGVESLPRVSSSNEISRVAEQNDASTSDSERNDQSESNYIELTKPGEQIIVAHGGEGGSGNTSFSKIGNKRDNVSEASEMDMEDHSSLSAGFPGSQSVLILELKSIADVGLVGMPNAGKSTLLGAISRAKPTVGHYAFTTLRPNIGKLNFDDISVTVADIPGLIKGAHENRGLGHAFLRHIERTKVLAYVVDLAAALEGRKGISPWEQLRDLVLELEYYREGLSGRPSLIVANKIDERGAEGVYEELKRRVLGVPIFPVCAVLEEGIQEVKEGLRMLVNDEESYQLSLDKITLD